MIAAAAWAAFIAHLIVAIVARRRVVTFPLVPLANLVTAGCVLAYWAQRWYGYVARGVTWYATDQVMPLYALLVGTLAAFAVWGRSEGGAVQWAFLTIDGVALLGAALLFSVLRFDRMI
ncbi:MAG: hypothetical protein ABI601_05705 [bacterium]